MHALHKIVLDHMTVDGAGRRDSVKLHRRLPLCALESGQRCSLFQFSPQLIFGKHALDAECLGSLRPGAELDARPAFSEEIARRNKDDFMRAVDRWKTRR